MKNVIMASIVWGAWALVMWGILLPTGANAQGLKCFPRAEASASLTDSSGVPQVSHRGIAGGNKFIVETWVYEDTSFAITMTAADTGTACVMVDGLMSEQYDVKFGETF